MNSQAPLSVTAPRQRHIALRLQLKFSCQLSEVRSQQRTEVEWREGFSIAVLRLGNDVAFITNNTECLLSNPSDES
jgi:hypothetical protein